MYKDKVTFWDNVYGGWVWRMGVDGGCGWWVWWMVGVVGGCGGWWVWWMVGVVDGGWV